MTQLTTEKDKMKEIADITLQRKLNIESIKTWGRLHRKLNMQQHEPH